MTQNDLRIQLENQRVELIAPRLLGSILKVNRHIVQIVEVEAYAEKDDPGSHAFVRKSPKNETMFGPPGHAYVYFTYGNHWMLNIVAHPEHQAAAILIRAAKPISPTSELFLNRPTAKSENDLLSGPGKLTAALGIKKHQNGIDLLNPNSDIQIIPQSPPQQILITTRIGLAPGKGDLIKWRFVDEREIGWASHPNKRD